MCQRYSLSLLYCQELHILLETCCQLDLKMANPGLVYPSLGVLYQPYLAIHIPKVPLRSLQPQLQRVPANPCSFISQHNH